MAFDGENEGSFGELLARYRTQSRMSREKLAACLQVHRNTVVKWEQGDSLPKDRTRVEELVRCLKLAGQQRDTLLRAALLDPSPTIWHVPYAQNPLFTGREGTLSRLEQPLQARGSAALMTPLALSGLGGIGKTSIAVEYAYRHRQEYTAVLWLQADSWDILSSEAVKLAQALQLAERDDQDPTRIIEAVRHWLKGRQRWLLILDNVEDFQMVQALLPTGHRGCVLLTTRAQITGPLIRTHQVPTMNEREGILFLLHRTEHLPYEVPLEQASPEHYAHAKRIWQYMDGLPLALDQAGAYILETGCSFSDYLTLYRNQQSLLLKKRGRMVPPEHPASVATTFALSFEKIGRMNAVAAEVLRACAFLYPEAIPEELLQQGAPHLYSHLASIVTDLDTWNQAMAVLRAYSLIRRDGERRMFSVHRLLQAVMRDEMDESTQRQWAERLVRGIAQLFPVSDLITWSFCERLLPHAMACSTFIAQWEMAIPEAVVLLNHVGKYLHDFAQYEVAESFFQRSLVICRQLPELNPAYMAQSLNHLAITYRTQGKYEVAEVFFQRALAIEKLLADDDTLSVAVTLNNLALLYNDQGSYEKAEPLAQRSLAIYQRLLEPDHPHVALALNNLAVLYADQGRYGEAEPFYQKALAFRERVLGPDHPDTAQSLNNLANLYRVQEKYELSETFHRRALALRERVLGLDHPDTAHSLSNLGTLFIDQGKYEDAEPLMWRALHIREKMLGHRHLDTAISSFNLGTIHLSQEKDESAERLYRQSLSTFERVLGPAHDTTASCQKMLAFLYQEQKKLEELEALYQHTLATCEGTLGSHHPGTATSLNTLAVYYTSLERHEEAEPLFQRALTIRTKELGPEHPATVQSFHNLIVCYERQGKDEEATLLLQRVPVTAQSLHDLASFYEQKGKDEEAASILQSVRVSNEHAAESDRSL